MADFTDSANDDAGKTEETEIIMSDFDQQHSHKQGRKVQKLEYEKGRNHDYKMCAKYQKQFPLNNAFKVLLIKSLCAIILSNLSLVHVEVYFCYIKVSRSQNKIVEP